MIPIRDSVPSRRFPAVNFALIALNVLVFLFEVHQGEALQSFLVTWSLVPARFTDPAWVASFSWLHRVSTLVTFMFLHGGFWHLLGNMWFLYIFGDNVEDRLGHPRYLVFYFLCGISSGVIHYLSDPSSTIPTVGASGAIAGVMGAYLVLYPRARVLTLIPIIIIPWFVEIPAAVFLGVWIFIQFASAALTADQVTGVAWWAHVGGFAVGIAFLKILLWLPATGISRKLGEATVRQSSPRLQRTQPTAGEEEGDLQSVLEITPREARDGAKKIVTVRSGLRDRLLRVAVPPGVRDGTVLRLQGGGARKDAGERGDLHLTIRVGS
jgi:membrane associated rhomboid family serine protease